MGVMFCCFWLQWCVGWFLGVRFAANWATAPWGFARERFSIFCDGEGRRSAEGFRKKVPVLGMNGNPVRPCLLFAMLFDWFPHRGESLPAETQILGKMNAKNTPSVSQQQCPCATEAALPASWSFFAEATVWWNAGCTLQPILRSPQRISATWTETQKRALSRAKTSPEGRFQSSGGYLPRRGFFRGGEMGLEESKIGRKWREICPRAPEQPVRMDGAQKIPFVFP